MHSATVPAAAAGEMEYLAPLQSMITEGSVILWQTHIYSGNKYWLSAWYCFPSKPSAIELPSNSPDATHVTNGQAHKSQMAYHICKERNIKLYTSILWLSRNFYAGTLPERVTPMPHYHTYEC